ncbi:hypothetical protein BKA56DRAFT_490455 [Ilyonectria sp. MPI-CAGE-AT-0026]|nr:hypothetical protein BKA56DRAFT_490455 [Ilyonectria sp. MPI-CAGE-AT-0026]
MIAHLRSAESDTRAHDNIGPRLLLSVWILCGVAAIFLGLRVYCKILGRRGLWWDDGFLIGAFVALLAECGLIVAMVELGYGKHIWDFDQSNVPQWVLLSNCRTTFTVAAACWSKTSFGITLTRITDGWTKRFIFILLVSMNIFLGLSGLFPWVNCTPIKKSWSPFTEGTCWPSKTLVHYNIFSGAYSAGCDIILALLPWTVLRTLQMAMREKLGVGLAMSMGIFAGITAIIKTKNLTLLLESDFYKSVQLTIWDTAESSVTIMAASIPVLRVLIREAKSSARKYYHAEDEHNTYHTQIVSRRTHTSGLQTTRSARDPTADDGSDKGILNPQKGIFCINEVAVEYHPKEATETYEMKAYGSGSS